MSLKTIVGAFGGRPADEQPALPVAPQAELFTEPPAVPVQIEAFDADGQISADLIRYEAGADRALIRARAERALEAAISVDQVKQIHDLAVGMAAYARTANNHDLEADAAEIRLRATRRLGQIMQQQKETIGLNRGAAVPTRVDEKPTLASQGIDKNLAHNARTAAAMSEPEFESSVESVRQMSTKRSSPSRRSRRAESSPEKVFGHCVSVIRSALTELEPVHRRRLVAHLRYVLAKAARDLKKTKPAKQTTRKRSKPRPKPVAPTSSPSAAE
jgi:hypothetical protein